MEQRFHIDMHKVVDTLYPNRLIDMNQEHGALERASRLQRLFRGERVLLLNDEDGDGSMDDYQLVASVYAALPGKSISIVLTANDALHCCHLQGMPPMIRGACLHGSLPTNAYSSVITRLLAGKLDVLYITVERFISNSFANILRNACMPAIRFLCILDAQLLSPYAEQFRDAALVRLLQRPDVQYTSCIVVYVLYKHDVERLVFHLRRASISATGSYRGMTADELAQPEAQWLAETCRVWVTTFNMQSTIPTGRTRGIVYYNMPASIEQYIAAVRQLGEDGRPAFCHAFLDEHTYQLRRSHAYRDGAETWALRQLFSHLFFTDEGDDSSAVKRCSIQGASMLVLPWEAMETALNMTRYTLQLGIRRALFVSIQASALLDKSPATVQSELEQLKRQKELRVEFYEESLLVQVDLSSIKTQSASEDREEAIERELDQLQAYVADALGRLERYRLRAAEQFYEMFSSTLSDTDQDQQASFAASRLANQQQHRQLCSLLEAASKTPLDVVQPRDDAQMGTLEAAIRADLDAFLDRYPSIVSAVADGRSCRGIDRPWTGQPVLSHRAMVCAMSDAAGATACSLTCTGWPI
ncbi:hypothetical protein SYNPS1DRAFT_29243 [Syncephalis pseudoplumigaleata]|uniref:Helicase C-terminal domain-containing protein n=1 Tax=Syncephalis pseudoplumigaleata TaxID=1712513 RepID=A0A4P9YZI4_9FUNG|nr:hypothetical protein SYNPS1DRAFT_29243 [Syncephalis pseudoplumigaleata]|eukprot:RKP25012.1 hypothetical protein SYNPS1DRAFT_29243 [Syncephalis pseudoplumigaleata]